MDSIRLQGISRKRSADWSLSRKKLPSLHPKKKGDFGWKCHTHSVPPDLSRALDAIAAHFQDTAWIPEGREQQALQNTKVYRELVRSMRLAATPSQAVEVLLRQLLADISPGQRFRHTETVIAVLSALDESAYEKRHEIFAAFAHAPGAELARVSRFATRLRDPG